jgi:predicted helicase
MELTTLQPNEHGDWLNLRNDIFGTYIPLGDKDNQKSIGGKAYFNGLFSFGILTARDAWVWNFNKKQLAMNVKNTIEFYSDELLRFNKAKKSNPTIVAKDFIKYDPQKNKLG